MVKPVPRHSTSPTGTSDDEAFNTWLSQRLRDLYEADLQEPLPEDMLDLVRRGKKPR